MGVLYSIIIPAYNEESRIEKTLIFVHDFFSKKGSFEIIVITDGTDGTASLAKKVASKRKCIRIVEFKSRLGKGGAIKAGLDMASGKLLGFVDADMPVRASDMYSLFTMLKDSDCAIASRNAAGSEIRRKAPLARRISSKVFGFYVNALFGLGISDTQCGAKAIRRQAYTQIKDMIKSDGFEFDVEMLWHLKKAGLRISEIPVTWSHEDDSKFSLRYGPGMLASLLKTRVGA